MKLTANSGSAGKSESVWDYPRPPRLEPAARQVRIVHCGLVLADSSRALRVLETSHPPVYYIPQSDIAMEWMRPSPRAQSLCEFKGAARYWTIDMSGKCKPGISVNAAWSYNSPTQRFTALRDHLAFYANKVDECSVDGEVVIPQPGDFYGGWITSWVTGPFKGGKGTLGW
jgi:uncharacterized protein (DUF427 family)